MTSRTATMARFPEPEEPRPVTVCAREKCGEYLYEGQEVYEHDDNSCCPDCIIDYLLDQGVIKCIDLEKRK